jgi:hypothetical protein
MQVTLQGNDENFVLSATVGDNGDCGYQTRFAPPLKLTLPYLSPNTEMTITLTIGTNQKHMYVQWMDINSGDLGKRFAYGKSSRCFTSFPNNACNSFDENQIRDTNNLTRMFASKNMGRRPALSNTYLTWDRTFVKKINSLSFGYQNFNKVYARQ